MPTIFRRSHIVRAHLYAGACAAALTLMLASQGARAAGAECGADGTGADTLACAAASYPTGITYTGSDGLTLNLNNPAMTVQKTGGNGAVDLEGSGADLTVNATSLTSITATGSTTSGIYVSQAGAGNALVTIGGGSITSVGRAVQALNSGTGNAAITMNDGSITTTGNAGAGLAASSAMGDATVTVNGGTISTGGSTGAYGAYALTTGTGTATAVINGGIITVSGTTGNGLRAQSANGLSVIRMAGGTVTGGSLVTGIIATNNNAGTGTYDISITGGTVNGGNQAAVQGYSTAPGGVITIGKDAVINAKGGSTGVAVLLSGVNAAGGTVTTAGTITGQIKFTTVTANTLNIAGGSIAGNILGDGADTLNFDLGSGSFNYDAAYAITGVTSLVMKSGTVTLGSAVTADTVTITDGMLIVNSAINTPAFALNGGELSVSDDSNLGTGIGTLNFNGGILQVTGSAMTGPTRPFTWGTNGGGFDITDAGNVFTVGQALTGGQLTKLGGGTLVLSADNTYSGGTTISGGTLRLGDGGTTGSILGDVTNNGTLVFNRADTVTFVGAISGTGTVSQAGSGTTILTGNSNYTGDTYITGGGLQVSGGGVVNGTNFVDMETSLIVTSAGSAFTAAGDLVAGRGAGTATIMVDGGGHLTTGRSFLGEGSNYSTANAINVTVDGAGSVLSAGSYFQLGASAGGTAVLTISNGALMTTDPAGMGLIGGGGAGTALVTGVGSQLLSGDLLYIGTPFNGGTGNGKLTIQDGGMVAAATVALGYNDGVSIGNNGTLNVLGTPGARGVLETASLSKGNDTASATFDGGILRASASSTAFISSHAGDYVTIGAGGMFIDSNGFDVTASSGLAGTGMLTKQGAGTLTLTGANSYAGGTTITAGTLQLGDGNASGSISGNVADNGALAFSRSDAVIFIGLISGSGAVSQVGAGTTILTGTNTYTGGTAIATGTLQLGNGGASGSITGNVTDNGTLVFARSDAVNFAGVISGSGIVGQAGSGNTRLSGVNIYSGGTFITAGMLTGSATSFGAGAITDNAALVIDQAADAGFTNTINGSGSFTKQGAGRLNYTGTGSLSGATIVAAGTLSVNGALAASAVTVQNGATLGGNGTVGGATIQSGATVAPGNSIGTLHVAGAYTQAAGSIYQVQLDPNSNSADLITASGAATLASGAGLSVAKDQPGAYRLGTTYAVLHADGGVSGTYTLSGDTLAASPYLGLRDRYDANNVYLEVVQTADPATAAQTGNQTQTATGVASLPASGDVGSAVLNTPDPATTRGAFDQLSGEALASAGSMLISGSVLVRDTTFDRLRDMLCDAAATDNHRTDCGAQKATVWMQGFGDWSQVYGTGNAAGVSQTTGGFLVGVDVPVAGWRLGFFGGHSRSDFEVVAHDSAGTSDSNHLGVYGGTAWGDLGLRLGASYSWNGLTTARHIAFDDFANDLGAHYHAGTAQVFGEVGQAFALDAFTVEPFANLAYVNLRTDGFSETGGAAALTGQANTMEDTFTTLGVRPAVAIALGSVKFVARGTLGWRHTFGSVTPQSVVAFDGGNAFTVTGAPIARDAGVVEAGVNADLSGGASIALTYGGQFSNRASDNSIRGTLAVSF